MLIKLSSKSVQESISKLVGGRKQSLDGFSVGSTVQPVVLVNNGVLKRFSTGVLAGNATWSIDIPSGKIWKIIRVRFNVSTDATVANRVGYFNVYDKDLNENKVTAAYTIATTASLSNQKYTFADGLNGTSFNIGYGGLNNFLVYDIDKLYVNLGSGVAGDSYSVLVEVLEFDIKDD